MSDCGCVYSSGNGDDNEFEASAEVRARKAHRCCECRETIPPRTTYRRDVIKNDGRLSAFKTCAPCAEIRSLLFCEGYTFGQMWEDVREYFHSGGKPFGCINKLELVAAKEKLAAEYRAFLGLNEATL